jgi:hypothetical protein
MFQPFYSDLRVHVAYVCVSYLCIAIFLSFGQPAVLMLTSLTSPSALRSNVPAILIYAFTCGIAGYVSTSMYMSLDGVNWVWNIVLTASIFTAPFFIIWSTVNTVAWYVH